MVYVSSLLVSGEKELEAISVTVNSLLVFVALANVCVVVSAGSCVNSPPTTRVRVACIVVETSCGIVETISGCVVSHVIVDQSTWASVVVAVFGMTVVRVALAPTAEAGLNEPIAVEPADAEAAHITSLPSV